MASLDRSRASEDYGLSAIAQHIATESFPAYDENVKGLGIYVSAPFAQGSRAGHSNAEQNDLVTAFNDGCPDINNPPTPQSGTNSEGIRTRSGRSAKRADSPFSTTKSRLSKSPITRPRGKKGKVERPKMPKLTAPLSVLTKDMKVPVKDMDEWVNRSVEIRRQEVAKRNGYVTRPMNSFMLYRSAYADRTKQWCLQNNHQVVSSVSGESWPMEPSEVRDQFNEWAKIERANHAIAHPDYKFAPSKANAKKRKGEETDEDDDSIDLDDPDGDYRGPKTTRRRQAQTFVPSQSSSHDMPYYAQQGICEGGHYAYTSSRPLPSTYEYNLHPQMANYTQLAVQPPPSYQHAIDMQAQRASTPQSLGGYGLPGTQGEDLFDESRHSTPMQQPYNYYGPQATYMLSGQRGGMASYPATTQQQLFEHEQFLSAQLQPQHGIDPTLGVTFTDVNGLPIHTIAVESHFDNAFNEYGAEYVYTDGRGNVDATLAPAWSPADALK